MDLAGLVKLLTVVGLVVVMLSMGLKVTLAEVVASTRRPRLILLGLVANFVLVPAVTVGLLRLFDPVPMVAAGFLILAVCPGAPVGPPFAAVAKGDVPYAIGLMVILAGLSAVLSPVLLGVLMPELPEGDLHIDYAALVATLLAAQVLPLAIGLGVHHRAPGLTRRIVKPVGQLAGVMLIVIVVLILVQEYDTLRLIRPRGWVGMLLLLAAGLGIGWLCGGPGSATRKSLALTTAVRNAAVGLVIVANNFADTPAVTAVVAFALVSMLASLGCAFLFAAVSVPGVSSSKRVAGIVGE
jgi:BASS family bile acid:Na+ symporter